MSKKSVKNLAKRLELLLLDVDGVLTDGGIFLGEEGFEAKKFDVKDGKGISLAQEVGIEVGIITGRSSEAVSRRANELGIEKVFQSVDSKRSVLESLRKQNDLTEGEIAYMGDDVQDLPILNTVGLPLAPSDARPRVREVCRIVSDEPGGNGAVRDVVEQILVYRD